MITIVYAATEGDCSSYRIAAVFTEYEKAEEWIRKNDKLIKCMWCHGKGLLYSYIHHCITDCSHCDGAGYLFSIYEIEEFELDPQ